MNFRSVLHELELQPIASDVDDWVHWAKKWRTELPEPFLDALELGAAELLTRHSNAEVFSEPLQHRSEAVELKPYQGADFPIIPLLWENQGNFVFGLYLNGESDPPVLISHEFERLLDGHQQPVQWQLFSATFNVFAFSRLHDFQYLWNASDQGWDDAWFDEFMLPIDFEEVLGQQFKRGFSTPYCYDTEFGDTRHRFYRSGQRICVNCDGGRQAYIEFSSATEELYHALKTEFFELLGKNT